MISAKRVLPLVILLGTIAVQLAYFWGIFVTTNEVRPLLGNDVANEIRSEMQQPTGYYILGIGIGTAIFFAIYWRD